MEEPDTHAVSQLPKWHQFMAPLLEVLSDGRVWRKRDMEKAILDRLAIPESQREEMLDSGQFRALNRIGWATSKLRMARAIEAPQRATFQITDAGRVLLTEHRDGVSIATLESLPAYQEYIPVKGKNSSSEASAVEVPPESEATPEEQIRAGISAIKKDVKTELLQRLREADPYFFERVVRQLLVKMGYGVEGELRRLTGSGDSGIDGVIDRDELGLSRIYIQAKRYADNNVVGRPMLQGFFGALVTRGASTGVFFTTSRFSGEAVDAADRAGQDVALVDGPRLADLMIKHRVGVDVAERVELIKLDEDFFV